MKRTICTTLAIAASYVVLAGPVSAAVATGGWYIEGIGFLTHAQVQEEGENEFVCAGEAGGIADVEVTSVSVEDGHIVVTVEATCNDGSTEEYTMTNGGDNGNPNAEYQPDPPPPADPPACTEAHYTDDGWDEGDCQ